MVRLLVTAAAAALLGTIASAGVANATPEARVPDLSKQIGDGEVGLSYAQYRRYNRGGRYGYYRRGRGGSAAGLIGGLAAGALIGGAIASQQAQAAPPVVGYSDQGVSYCMQRFRSYDPESGTYLGNDGMRHPCP
jgi:hypothetical protein